MLIIYNERGKYNEAHFGGVADPEQIFGGTRRSCTPEDEPGTDPEQIFGGVPPGSGPREDPETMFGGVPRNQWPQFTRERAKLTPKLKK